MTMTNMGFIVGLLLIGAHPAATNADEHRTNTHEFPPFEEVYSLIRSNLSGVREAELNRLAVVGLLAQLRSQVLWMTNTSAAASSGTGSVVKTAVFERSHAYVRLGDIRPGTARAFPASFDQLQASNKLSGLVLDLRFASGDDYAEAAALADLFLSSEQPLLRWGENALRSTAKTNAITLPVVMLMNQATSGASEALVAALRSTGVGLVVGSRSAGHTHAFKEFPLSYGQKIGIAAGRIEVGDGQSLSEHGITPDIEVRVSLEAEKNYLENPFNATGAASGRSLNTNATDRKPAEAEPVQRPRRDESSLLRQRREESDQSVEAAAAVNERPAESVVQDPALARALDVLKGLALAKNRR